MASNMMKELTFWMLDSYLSRYIKNIDKVSLKGSLWRGHVQLGGQEGPLEIKPEALVGENMPVQVVFGVLEEFSLHVPWTTILGYGDIEVGIKGLYAVVEPTAAQEYDAEQEARTLQALKEQQIQKIEQAAQRFRKQQAGINSDQEASLWDSILTYTIQHLRVKVEDVHIVYKDTISVPGCPYVLGLSLDSIVMKTENAPQSKSDQVNKTLYLNSLAVYWNSEVDSREELTWQYLKDHIARVQSNSYILDPVSAEVRLVINCGDSTSGITAPKMSACIQLDDLTLELSSLQFRDIIKLYKAWDMMRVNGVYKKYQPMVKLSPPSPQHVVRQWWQYVISSVLEVQVKPSKWYLHKILQHWRWFKEYLECYEQKLKQPNPPPNAVRKLKDLETKLGAVAICMARAEADRRVLMADNSKSQQHSGGAGYLGWAYNKVYSWLGYGDDSGDVVPSNRGRQGSGLADFLDQMPPDERERFYSNIRYSDYEVSLRSKEYVKTAINMSVRKLRLLLLGQSGNIGALVFHDIEMLFEQRPSAEAIKAVAEVARLTLWGRATDDLQQGLVRMVADKQNPQDSGSKRRKELFHFEFETNPLERDADFSVKAYLHPVEVKLYPPTLVEVGKFLTVEDPNYVDVLWRFAEQKLEEFSRQATENLIYSLENRKVVFLDVDLKSPYFIVPESGELTSEASSIVIDLGHLSVKQHRSRRDSLHPRYVDLSSMDSAFVQYDVQLVCVRILVADHDDDWRKASSRECSPLDLLVPTELKINVLQSMQSDNPLLPKLRIESVLPSLEIRASDNQLSTLVKVLSSLPLFNRTPTQRQRRQVQPTPQAVSQVSFTPTEEDIIAVVGATVDAESDFLSADDALSFYSAEEDFPDGCDVPDSPAMFKGQSLVRFDLKLEHLQMDVRLLQSNGALQDYLSAEFRRLSFEADFRHDNWETEVKLSYASIVDRKRHKRNGDDLQLFHTSSSEGMVAVGVARMEKKSPHFSKPPHFGEWEWTVSVGLNSLWVEVDQDAFFEIRAVLERIADARNSRSLSLSPSSSVSTETGMASNTEPEVPQQQVSSSNSWHIRTQLESLHVLVVENRRPIAVVDIHNLGGTMSVNDSSTVIEAKLRNLAVEDKRTSAYSSRIVSLAESVDGVFNICLRLGKASKSSHFVFNNALSVDVGQMRIVYLHSFFNRGYLFARGFTNAWAQLAKTTETMARSAQKTVAELQETGSSVEVSITVSAPLVHIPESSQSPNALLLNLGRFSIRNSLTDYQSARLTSLSSAVFASEQRTSSSVRVEHYRLRFAEFGLVRLIRHGESSKRRTLLKQMKLEVDATRCLAVRPRDESVPLVHVWGEIPGLRLFLKEDDYHSVVKTYIKNLGRSYGSGSHHQAAAQIEPGTDVVDLPGSARTVVKLRLSVGDVKLRLFMDDVEPPSSESTSEEKYGTHLALCKIHTVQLNGIVLADGAKKLTASVSEVMLDDTRPNRPGAIKQILSHNKKIPSVPAVRVKYDEHANGDRSVECLLDRPHISLCMKFLLRLQKFFSDSETLDDIRLAWTDETDAVPKETIRRGRLSRRFARSIRQVAAQLVAVQPTDFVPYRTGVIPEDEVLSNDVDGPLPLRSVSPVVQYQTPVSPWKLSLQVKCNEADLIVPERAKDKNCPALILQGSMTLDAVKEAGKTHVAASVRELGMVSCVLSEPLETKICVLRPCKAEMEGTFTSEEEHLLLQFYQIDVTLYHSVLETLNSLLKSYKQNIGLDERITEIPAQTGDDLLVVREVDKERWKTPQPVTDAPTTESSKEQQLLIDAGSVSVTLQVKHTDVYRPVVVIRAAINGELLNWSHYPTAGADVELQASYFNSGLDAWEPLIEPIEGENGKYRKWKMSVQLIQMLNQSAVFGTDIKLEDELIQKALSPSGSELSQAEPSEVRSPVYSVSSMSSSQSSLSSGVQPRLNLAPRRSVGHVSATVNFSGQVSSDDTDAPTSTASELASPGGVVCNCVILTSTEPVQLVASTASLSTLSMAYEAWYSDSSHPNRQSVFHPSVDEILIQIENTVGLKVAVIPEAAVIEGSAVDSRFAVEPSTCLTLLYSSLNGTRALRPVEGENKVVGHNVDLQSQLPRHPWVTGGETAHALSDGDGYDDVDEPEPKPDSDTARDQTDQFSNSDDAVCNVTTGTAASQPFRDVWVTAGESSHDIDVSTENSNLCGTVSQEDSPTMSANVVCVSSSLVFTGGDTSSFPELSTHESLSQPKLADASAAYDPFQELECDVFETDELSDDDGDEPDGPSVRGHDVASLLRQLSSVSTRGLYDTHQALEVRRLFSVQFENCEETSHIPLNKTCTTFLPLGSVQGDQKGFAVCEVVCKPHEKTVKIRSPLQIENHLSDEIEILCQMPDDSSDGYTHTLTVASSQLISIPIHVAYNGKMFLKPTRYRRGERSLSWIPGVTQECSFHKFTSESGDVAPTNVQVSWKTTRCQGGLGRKTSSMTVVHIHPPVVIANLLPIEMSYRLQDEAGEYQRLEKGNEEPFARLSRVSGVQTVHVRIIGYQSQREWVGAFEFSHVTVSNAVIPLKVEAVTESGKRRKLHFSVHVVRDMGIRLSVFCPYWIVNKTTLPLIFKGKKGFRQRSTGRGEDVLLLSFGRMANHKLKFTLEHANSFSSNFPVNAVGNVDVVGCEHDGTMYEVQVKIQMSYTSLTKVITLTPRYVMHNNSQYTLECSTPPWESWLSLEPTQCEPFWPTQTKKMQVRFARSSLKSWPFGFDETTSFLLLLRVDSAQPVCVVSVNVREEGVSRVITFGPYYAGAAPIRLENYLGKASIEFHQAGSGQTHILQPGQSMLYTWDEPLNPKYICWRPVGSGQEMKETYCIDGKGEFVIPLRRKTTFIAAELGIITAAASVLPTIKSESDEDMESIASGVETSSVRVEPDRQGDQTSLARDETDFFRRKRSKSLYHPVGHWVCFLDGSQRTLLFTTDPVILKKATQVEQLDRAYTDLFVSFAGVSISVIDRQPQEIAHISMLGTAYWEICLEGENIYDGEEWQPLNVHLSNLVEETYLEQQQRRDRTIPSPKKPQVEVSFSDEVPVMIKPYRGKLKRTFNPGFWYRWALSDTRSVNHVKLGRIQVDNQMDCAPYAVALSELPPLPAMRPAGTVFEIAWMSQQINPKSPVQYKVRASVEPLEASLDLGFVFSFWRALQPETEEERTETNEMHRDLESMEQLEWQNVSIEGTTARNSSVEYLHIDPAEVKLNLSLQKGNAPRKEDASKLDRFQLFIGSLGFSLPSFEGIDLTLDALQRIGGTMDATECWSLVLSHYQHQALSKAYKAVLGLDIGTSSIRGFVQDMTSFSDPFADVSLYQNRDANLKDDLALGVRSALGHVSGGTASLVGKTATSIGHRLASLTFDKKFQRERQQRMKRLSGSVGHGLKLGGQALALGLFDGVTGIVRQPVRGAKRKGAAGLIKGIGKGLVGVVTRPVGGLVDMAAFSLRTVRLTDKVETRPIRLPRCIKPNEALQPYSAHQAKLHFLVKSLKKDQIHIGHYVADCLLDPRTSLILTTEYVLVLGRDNSGSEWRIECNSSVGRTVALPDLARDPSQAVKTDPNNILLCQEGRQQPVIVMPNRATCREFANQVKQQLCVAIS